MRAGYKWPSYSAIVGGLKSILGVNFRFYCKLGGPFVSGSFVTLHLQNVIFLPRVSGGEIHALMGEI